MADLNDDGFPDLYVLNMQGDNHYFENQGGKTFVDRTPQVFPRTPWGAMGIKFFDYDNDGRLDLLVTDMHSDMSLTVGPEREKLKSRMEWTTAFLQGDGTTFIFGNAFFHNTGAAKIEEISDRVGVENYWPWGPSVGDLNADGWQDVFIASSMNYPYPLRHQLAAAQQPRRDVPRQRVHPRHRAAARRADAYAVVRRRLLAAGVGQRFRRARDDRARSRSWRRSARGRRSSSISTRTATSTSSPTTSTPSRRCSSATWPSAAPMHWLGVALSGTASNRNGLGARVRVTAGGRVLTQWHDGKSGYLSQSVLPLYFGLGDAATVERVEVEWPSGRTQVLTSGLTPNTTLRVTEPGPPRSR